MGQTTRFAEAKVVAENLLSSLERGADAISQNLMKAKRVARLLRDADAQNWLDFEMMGYPNPFEKAQIGYCIRYMKPRFNSDGSFKTSSLPEIEAEIATYQKHMEAIRFPSSFSSSGQGAAGPFGLNEATTLLGSINISLSNLSNSLVDDVQVFAALKSALHSYATDCQVSLEFGDISADIFEKARLAVDSFVRQSCPKAAGQLLAAYERLGANDAEERAQCLTSCRRVLLTVADVVFPSQDEAYRDTAGRKRKVGADDYKNRLLAFLDQRLGNSESTFALIEGEVEHLAARLDAIYEKVSKGVHADVSQDEAQLAMIHTYLFLAEVARVWPLTLSTSS